MEVTKEEYQEEILKLGKLVFDFARVHRVTYHDDGVTLESDTDHTVMLSVVACSLSDTFYKESLDSGKVAQYAIVHDLVEAYAGYTDTFSISQQGRKEKEYREERARNMIEDMFLGTSPWLPKTITEYDRMDTKEARFVKTVDKMMPIITHILNKGTYFKRKRMAEKDMVSYYHIITDTIEKGYGREFPEIVALIKQLIVEARKKTYDQVF